MGLAASVRGVELTLPIHLDPITLAVAEVFRDQIERETGRPWVIVPGPPPEGASARRAMEEDKAMEEAESRKER
jgi:hypothetical protein